MQRPQVGGEIVGCCFSTHHLQAKEGGAVHGHLGEGRPHHVSCKHIYKVSKDAHRTSNNEIPISQKEVEMKSNLLSYFSVYIRIFPFTVSM